MDFEVPENMQVHAASVINGEYNVPIYNPEPDTITVLDLGMNIGSFSIWANFRWKPLKIYGYEPIYGVYEIAEKNLQKFKNIEVSNVAVRKDGGSGEMFLGESNCGENSFFAGGVGTGEESVEVVSISARDLPPANVIKLDIEGCEKEVLENIDNLDFDLVLLEYHSEKARKEIDNILENYLLFSASATCKDRGVLKYVKDTPQFRYYLSSWKLGLLQEGFANSQLQKK